MQRYKDTQIGIDKDNNRVYKPTFYPKIEILDSDIFIISKDKDRLDLLANKYYSDPSLWWVIAKANDITLGKFSLNAGLELRIPMNIPKIVSDLEQLNKGF